MGNKITHLDTITKQVEEFKAGTYGMEINNAAAYMYLQLQPTLITLIAEILDNLEEINRVLSQAEAEKEDD